MTLEVIIDWIQFTTKRNSPINTIIDILHLDVKDFKEMDRGALGYKRQKTFNNISILYDGNRDGNRKKEDEKFSFGMGTHVIMSGKACRYYESQRSLKGLFDRMNKFECKSTRIDLAIDDRKGKTILLDNIIEDVKKGNTISRWKKSLELTERSLRDGEVTGRTINLGGRSSEVFLRIYNKSMQQKEEGNWIRMEVEIKKKKAQELQRIINTRKIGPITKEIINNYIRMVESCNDKNKSRWKTREYWLNIMQTTEKLSLTVKPEPPDLDKSRKWILGQVSATMATVVLADGSDKFLSYAVEEGKKKMRTNHRIMVNDQRRREEKYELYKETEKEKERIEEKEKDEWHNSPVKIMRS